MKTFAYALTAAMALGSTMAVADSSSKLPEGATALSKAQVILVYDGKLFNWRHPNGDFGTTTYNAKAGTIGGVFNIGGKTGEWEGKVTWKGDQYCFRTRGKGKGKFGNLDCNLIYSLGETVYEVDPKTKRVKSVNTKN